MPNAKGTSVSLTLAGIAIIALALRLVYLSQLEGSPLLSVLMMIQQTKAAIGR